MSTPTRARQESTPVRTRQECSLAELIRLHDSGGFSLWRGNREINPGHARRLADALLRSRDAGPTPIVLGALADGGVYLLDGQHRLAAARQLPAAARAAVSVEVVRQQCGDEAGLRRLFRVVNDHLPVPPVFYDEELKEFAAAAADAIVRRWPKAASKATVPCRPQFTRAILSAQLATERWRTLVATGRLTVAGLLAELEYLDADVRQQFRDNRAAACRRYGMRTGRCLETAEKVGFYAGLCKEWPDLLASALISTWRAEDDEAEEEDAEDDE